MMQYRTRRRGFHYYVQGQVKEIAKMLFLNTGQLDNKLDAKEEVRFIKVYIERIGLKNNL